MVINYYCFDKIEKDDLGCHWGYKGNNFCEVFPLSDDDTEADLVKNGFAKCDSEFSESIPSPTETFLVEESSILKNQDGSWELR
jgi:hypothetical protein